MKRKKIDVSCKRYQRRKIKPEKYINRIYPEEVGIVFCFFSRAGPVPETFRRLELGALLEPVPAAGAFWTREAGGAPGSAESGTIFSSTWRTGSAETGITGNT
jgi:hypothetical protein